MKKATKKAAAKKPAKKKAPAKKKVEKPMAERVLDEVPEPVPEPIPEPVPEPIPEPVPEPVAEEEKGFWIYTIQEIAERAWNTVKGKDDADFAHCEPSFRSNLLYHAEGVQKTLKPMTGDTVHARFEQEVKKRLLGG